MFIKQGVEEVFSAELIQQRVKELGHSITERFKDSDNLVLVGLLRGSCIFLADLCREVKLPVTIDFMAVTSYLASTDSSRDVRIIKDLNDDIKGKHVVIVEDIVDTGHTLTKVLEMLKLREPHSISICTLLDKPSRREVDVDIAWLGFSVEDVFLVGYGIDHKQQYRNLPYIGKLVEEYSSS